MYLLALSDGPWGSSGTKEVIGSGDLNNNLPHTPSFVSGTKHSRGSHILRNLGCSRYTRYPLPPVYLVRPAGKILDFIYRYGIPRCVGFTFPPSPCPAHPFGNHRELTGIFIRGIGLAYLSPKRNRHSVPFLIQLGIGAGILFNPAPIRVIRKLPFNYREPGRCCHRHRLGSGEP